MRPDEGSHPAPPSTQATLRARSDTDNGPDPLCARVSLDRMPGRTRLVVNVFSLLGAFVAAALVLGVLTAGLFIPAVGATGSVTKAGIDLFDGLPSDFTRLPLPQSSKILDAKGGLIATPYTENRIIVKLDKISPIMREAQVAIEDDRFYEHGGADLRGIARAAVQNAGSDDTQGASTLTQQYVKVTLFEQAARADDEAAMKAATATTYSRKLQELKYAIQVEKKLSKNQILENYLNLVFYGDGAYGIEAAAQHYFSTSAAKLTLSQSALLAGIVQDPSRCDPRNSPECAQERRDVVLDRMYQLDKISAKSWKAAKKKSVPKMLKIAPPKNNCTNSNQPYFCQYVLEWLKTQPALGDTPAERLNLINTGGLVIKTTLDPALSKYAHDQLVKKVYPSDYKKFGAAASLVEPGTGKVLAMAQSSDFKTQQLNWNVPAAMGGSTFGFGIGSTAKVYSLIRALSTGTPVSGSIDAKSATASTPAVYQISDFKDDCKPDMPYKVRNDFAAGGRITLARATAQSINTAFASLTAKLGACKVRDTMKLMGLKSGDGGDPTPFPSDIILGSLTVAPLTLASSYAALAADGKFCEPVPVASVATVGGKEILKPKAACKQVIKADVARGVTELLKGPISGQGATGSAARLPDGRVAAGKTGTDEDYNESWFVGYTAQRALAVWVGTPLGNSTKTNMRNVTMGGQYYGQVFGGTIAAPLWSTIMNKASEGLPKKDFPSPSDKVKNGDLVDIPNVYGRSVSDATAQLEGAGFDVSTSGPVDSTVGRGLVAFTSPGGRAIRGDTVTIYTSTGTAPKPKVEPKPKDDGDDKKKDTKDDKKPKTPPPPRGDSD